MAPLNISRLVRQLAISLMVSDPTTALDTIDVAAKGQSIIRGAFHLLALQR